MNQRFLTIGVWLTLLLVAAVVVLILPRGATVGEALPGAPAEVTFHLKAEHREGRSVFVGVGGAIAGMVNPVLEVKLNATVQIMLENGQSAVHDVAVPAFDSYSAAVKAKGEKTSITLKASRAGSFDYYCTISSHRAAGMEGLLKVAPTSTSRHGHGAAEAKQTSRPVGALSRDPTDLPPPLTRRGPQTVDVRLVAQQIRADFDQGRSYEFFTYNGKVPGPFIRVRVGDTVDVRLFNPAENDHVHSVDFHAATGRGGGGAVTQAEPGEERRFTFVATTPGLFVYHCATPLAAQHLANGMYGLILVEPENGLSPVESEYYVMQQELYTDLPFTERGEFAYDSTKLMAEQPEFFLFNGAIGGLGRVHPWTGTVGDRARIFFGVGGPNAGSSFHLVGEIMDSAYSGGSFSDPQRDLQTLFVPPGSAAIVEFSFEVPGPYMLMDHALAREARGAMGVLTIAEAQP